MLDEEVENPQLVAIEEFHFDRLRLLKGLTLTDEWLRVAEV